VTGPEPAVARRNPEFSTSSVRGIMAQITLVRRMDRAAMATEIRSVGTASEDRSNQGGLRHQARARSRLIQCRVTVVAEPIRSASRKTNSTAVEPKISRTTGSLSRPSV
jgi:hypothetical protein